MFFKKTSYCVKIFLRTWKVRKKAIINEHVKHNSKEFGNFLEPIETKKIVLLVFQVFVLVAQPIIETKKIVLLVFQVFVLVAQPIIELKIILTSEF